MSRTARRWVIGGLALLLTTGALAPAAADPVTPPASAGQFERLDLAGLRAGNRGPAVLDQTDPNRTVSALVQLDVASVEAQLRTRRGAGGSTGHRPVSRSAALRRVAASQDLALPRLRAAGATPYGRLSTVLNAVQVRVRVSDLARIADVPGVRRVQVSRILTRSNTAANRYTGVDQTWQRFGLTGRGQTIGVIDSGIDYTHADFGGAGTTAAYVGNNSNVVERGSFPTAKVTGGYDFVGDRYDPGSDFPGASIPVPDPDPLDCEGHGTHVAGTAAGDGVTAGGQPYAGPYDVAALGQAFAVQPGAAPQARLKAYKVFGCTGGVSNDIVVAAIDRAVSDGVDVINLSLGSTLGEIDSMEDVAIAAATQAGVLVVAAAGNDGGGAYLVGAPSSGDQALSVAAVDAEAASYPGATISGAVSAPAMNINAMTIDPPVTGTLVDVGLGCSATDYAAATGRIAVATRGTCARTDRAKLGQAAGALAVVLANTDAGQPTYDGPVAGVTVPFLGVTAAVGVALRTAAGRSVTLTASAGYLNATYRQAADFSSGGPRRSDSAQKPDLAAPGVAIPSAAVGTGSRSVYESGTSMATPHTAGIAALVRQAHPDWSAVQVKGVLMSTAAPDQVAGFTSGRAGAGLVQPMRAAVSDTFTTTASGLNSLRFGMAELTGPYSETRSFELTNRSSGAVTYDLSSQLGTGSPNVEVVTSPRAVTVAAGATASVAVTLRLNRAQVAALPGARASDRGVVASIRGAVVATPRTTSAATPTLRTMFLLVPVPLSDVTASSTVTAARNRRFSDITVTNQGAHSGTADLYAWLLSDPAGDVVNQDTADITTVGVQALPGSVVDQPDTDRLLVFAVGLATGTSTQSVREVDLSFDTDRDGSPDFYTYVIDIGLPTTGTPAGRMAALTIDNNGQLIGAWSASAPANGSTLLLPVLASQIGVTADSGAMAITARGFYVQAAASSDYEYDPVDATAKFDPYTPVVSQGDSVTLDPGETAAIPVRVDTNQLRRQTSRGWLVVTQDDAAGRAEATRVTLGGPNRGRVVGATR